MSVSKQSGYSTDIESSWSLRFFFSLERYWWGKRKRQTSHWVDFQSSGHISEYTSEITPEIMIVLELFWYLFESQAELVQIWIFSLMGIGQKLFHSKNWKDFRRWDVRNTKKLNRICSTRYYFYFFQESSTISTFSI